MEKREKKKGSEGKILVIVESPSKCRKIESFLGSAYQVVATFGHFRTLAGLGAIDVEHDFAPTFTIHRPARATALRKDIASARQVIIATDSDREGEAIGWHVCDAFGLSIADTPRIVFREITKSAIQSAIATPVRIDMQMVKSQQTRQIMDLLIGFTISPVLWNHLPKETELSAGRCQTPALRLVYDHYLDRLNKTTNSLSYAVHGTFRDTKDRDTKDTYPLSLTTNLSKEAVVSWMNSCKSWDFVASIGSPKKSIRQPPEPLTTSTLQQLASNDLQWSPKDTMKVAQELYEGGHITYMRTDCKKYSQEFMEISRRFISSTFGAEYIGSNKETKGAPHLEAHEAIRPVSIAVQTLTDEECTEPMKRLYQLIWTRTMQSCMASAQYQVIRITVPAPDQLVFSGQAESVLFLGWQQVGKETKEKEDKDKEKEKWFQTLLKNQKQKTTALELIRLSSSFELSLPPPHYTEARLIHALEEKGIGRPSTFASLVDKIQERKYVVKQEMIAGQEIQETDHVMELIDDDDTFSFFSNVTVRTFGTERNKLVIQPLGIQVISFLISLPPFFDYEYTNRMEQQLDDLATNNAMIVPDLCFTCFQELSKLTKEKGKKEGGEKEQGETKEKEEKVLGKYQGHDLVVKHGKYGWYAQWGKDRQKLDCGGHTYLEVVKLLSQKVLDPSVPVGLIREVSKECSIRTGKYGDYIFYKKPRMTKPSFFKLAGFTEDYRTCCKDVLMDWIKTTYLNPTASAK